MVQRKDEGILKKGIKEPINLWFSKILKRIERRVQRKDKAIIEKHAKDKMHGK